MLNHIVIMGRMVADPELRTTPAGVAVATVRLAVDRDFKNKHRHAGLRLLRQRHDREQVRGGAEEN